MSLLKCPEVSCLRFRALGMHPLRQQRLRADQRGIAALEYAIVAPLFFLFVFGIIEVSRLAWTKITLERAVATAARCAALHSPRCASPALIANYASANAPALTIPSGAITVSYLSCGIKVSASLDFATIVPLGTQRSYKVTAGACSPVINSTTP